MPRFYFDFMTGEDLAPDDTGTVLADVAEAQAQAVAAAGEWIKDETASGAAAELSLAVRDGSPAPLFVVTACVTVSRGTE